MSASSLKLPLVDQTDQSGAEEEFDIQLDYTGVAPIMEYVRKQALHQHAANEMSRFALQDFLMQHQRLRANATLECEPEAG